MKCLTKCIYRGSKVGEDCEILIDPQSCQLFDDGAERNPPQQQVRKPGDGQGSGPKNLGGDLKEMLEIIYQRTEDTQCDYDHHGYCQAHNWFDESECINKRALKILKKYNYDGEG